MQMYVLQLTPVQEVTKQYIKFPFWLCRGAVSTVPRHDTAQKLRTEHMRLEANSSYLKQHDTEAASATAGKVISISSPCAVHTLGPSLDVILA